MKIIQIIPHLRNGGAERLIIDLCNEISKTDEVILCTLRKVDPTMFYISEIAKTVRLISLNKKEGLSLQLPFSLIRLFLKEKPQVVNSHLPSVFPYLIPSIIILRGVKFFHTIHNIPQVEEPRVWVRKIRKWFINRKKLYTIAISDEIGSRFLELYGVMISGIIFNGRSHLGQSMKSQEAVTKIEKLKTNAYTTVFVSVGRLWPQKNHGLLVRVFRQLYEMKRDVILIVLGEDYGTGALKEYQKEKAPNTFFLGAKNNVGDYLLNSDAFCLSSIYEGLPITILEAMSIGLPVISTNVGGIPDIIIDEINGFLSPVDDEFYLKALLKFLALSKEQIEIIKRNNIELYKARFSIQVTGESYLALYSKTINS